MFIVKYSGQYGYGTLAVICVVYNAQAGMSFKILNDRSILSVCELPCVGMYKINTKTHPVENVQEAMGFCNCIFQALITLFSDSYEFNRGI